MRIKARKPTQAAARIPAAGQRTTTDKTTTATATPARHRAPPASDTQGYGYTDTWSATDSFSQGNTYSLAESGTFGYGVYNMNAVTVQESATSADQYNESDAATQSGSDSGSNAITTTTTSGGSFGYSNAGTSDTQTSTETWSDTYISGSSYAYGSTQSQTSSESGSGTDLAGVASWNSVVYQGSVGESYTEAGLATSSSGGSDTLTLTDDNSQNNVSPLGTGTTETMTATSSFTECDGASFSASASDSWSAAGSDSVTVYQSGQFGNGSYNLGCLAISEVGADTWQELQSGATTTAGTQTTTSGGSGSFSMSGSFSSGVSLSQSGTSSSSQTDGAVYTTTDSASSSSSGSDSFAWSEAGAFANGRQQPVELQLRDLRQRRRQLDANGSDHGDRLQHQQRLRQLHASDVLVGQLVERLLEHRPVQQLEQPDRQQRRHGYHKHQQQRQLQLCPGLGRRFQQRELQL